MTETATGKKTTYHILRLYAVPERTDEGTSHGEIWELVDTDVEATTDKQARASYVRAEFEAGRTVDSPLVAVPARSWKPKTAKVTPSPQISFEDA